MGWLTENLFLKIFSLAMAVLLFLFVNVESSNAVDVEFAIEYRTDADIVIASDAPDRLHATLRGPWASFRSFDDLAPVVVDVTGVGPGTLRYRIEETQVRAPAGMSVASIRPSEIELTMDRLVEKEISVQVDNLGQPAFGFEIVEIKVTPARVRVEGPAARMRLVDFVHTEPIDLRDRQEDLEVDVALRPPPPPVRLPERASVKVLVDLREEIMERSFQVPVQLDNAPAGASVRPDNVRVTLKGPRRVVDTLQRRPFAAVVDLTQAVHDGATIVEAVPKIRPLVDGTQVVGQVPSVQVSLPRASRRSR